jgi:formylglycine-generating enzyme required for sulfatase activity
MRARHQLFWIAIAATTIILTAGCADDDDSGGLIPCPEGMVGFDGPDGAGCIETTEVTNTETVEFLVEHGNDCQGHPCVYADEPGSRIVEQGTNYTIEDGYENHPVVQITWHGAVAFCDSIGRSLCEDGAWVAACGGPSATAYPYGGTYDATACNGMDAELEDTAEVGSSPGCEGGYSGLFDMSGNVYEWTDACADGPCLIRGGSYDKPADDMACDGSHTMDGPSGHREDLGLRCCAPPI